MENSANSLNQNPNQSFSQEKESIFKRVATPKLIFVVLAGVIVVELIIGARTLLSTPPGSSSPPTAQNLVAQMQLETETKQFSSSDEILVKVRMSTGGHQVVGADLVLEYDPQILEATPASFIAGSTFPDYSTPIIDRQEGTFRVSGMISPGQPAYNGSDIFGAVVFRAKATGSTLIKVGFLPNATTQSNLIDAQSGENILAQTKDLEIIIK